MAVILRCFSQFFVKDHVEVIPPMLEVPDKVVPSALTGCGVEARNQIAPFFSGRDGGGQVSIQPTGLVPFPVYVGGLV